MKLYGLIGFPLGHSFSAKYFNEKFEKEGLSNCRFQNFPLVTIDEFPSLLTANPALKGLSITIPYKQQILKFVTQLSEQVINIGATNSIKIIKNKLIAYNTDIIGFERSFIKQLKPFHTKALVLGSGGASKAIQFVLKKLFIEFLVVTRDQHLKHGTINYTMINEQIMNDHYVIINCTPAGMLPLQNIFPDIPYHSITPKHYCFDLIYQPPKTMFLQKAQERGACIQNGYDMLIFQAEESWKIWNAS